MSNKVRVPLFALTVCNFGLTLFGSGSLAPVTASANCSYCSGSTCLPISGYWSGTTKCRSYPPSGGCNVSGSGCTS